MEVSPDDLQESRDVGGADPRVRLQVSEHQPIVYDDAVLQQGWLPSGTERGGIASLQHQILSCARFCGS